MFKSSQLLKSILIILAILIISGAGYTAWIVNTNTGNKKAAETKNSHLEQEVKELLSKVVLETYIRPDGGVLSFDFADPLQGEEPWYAEEHKLIGLGEKTVPILIEIIKEKENNRNNAIYILGCIGGEKSVDLLITIFKSQYEDFDARVYAAQALGKNKTTPKALDALKSVASNKNENDIVQKSAQEALDRKDNY